MTDGFPLPGVPSPCVGICQLDPTRRWCIGCLRTLQEIGEWSSASDARRREIVARLERLKGAKIEDR